MLYTQAALAGEGKDAHALLATKVVAVKYELLRQFNLDPSERDFCCTCTAGNPFMLFLDIMPVGKQCTNVPPSYLVH